jgi:hypothetical protein
VTEFADRSSWATPEDTTEYPVAAERLTFWQDQARRLELRWAIVSYAVISLLFWTTAILVVAWLRAFGLTPVAWALGAVWLYFASPTLYVHAQFILDALGYVLTRHTYFFPVLREKMKNPPALDELSPEARAIFTRLWPYFRAASFTSPLVAPATRRRVARSRSASALSMS